MASPESRDSDTDSTADTDSTGCPTPTDRPLSQSHLLDIVPRTQLVAWAKMGDADDAPLSPRSPPTIDTLTIRHMTQLVSELSPRMWPAHYKDHDGKRTQGAVLCIWLTKLGVKLPFSNAFGKDDFRNLLRDIATSCSKAYSRQHEPALPFLTKSLTKSGGLLYRLPAHLL